MFIGTNSGATTINGNANICIGYNAQASTGIIGATVIGTDVSGTVTNGLFFRRQLAVIASTAVNFSVATGQMGPATSSRRFKKDITTLEFPTGNVYNLNPVSYTWKHDGVRDFGLIAEEVVTQFPQLVPLDGEGLPYSVNYDKISVLLLEEIKKLRERIEQLEAIVHKT